MFPKERRKEIISIVNSTGFATVNDLAKRFAVSVDSIRKDLKVLQKEGKIKREYGGALKVDGPVAQTPRVRSSRSTTAMRYSLASLARTSILQT